MDAAWMPLPDVEAVAFELRSLCTGDCLTLPGDVQSLIQRLHFAQVHLVALHVSEEACVPSTVTCGDGAADHACRLFASALPLNGTTVVLDVASYASACAAVETLKELAAQRWRVPSAAVAVVAGASALNSLLAACAAADLRAVLLSASLPPPLLPPAVAHAARAADVPRALAQPGDVVVGAALSEARARSLFRAAVVHPLPRRGLCLLLLDIRCSLATQAPWHALLHKATDALAGDALPCVLPLRFTPEMEALRLFAAAERTPWVDSFRGLSLVLDRGETAELLARMPARLGGVPVGAPKSVCLESFNARTVAAALADAGISMPCLLKPRAACGVPYAHSFALLSSPDAAQRSSVALPALAQAFVRHDAQVHKAYVYGATTLTQSRKSLPDPPLHQLPSLAPSIPFDALRAMPISWPGCEPSDCDGQRGGQSPGCSDAAIGAIADWLRQETGMRLFGFDVLVEAGTGAHLVVDLNYFPTGAGVAGAAEAFASALRQAAAAGGVRRGH